MAIPTKCRDLQLITIAEVQDHQQREYEVGGEEPDVKNLHFDSFDSFQ